MLHQNIHTEINHFVHSEPRPLSNIMRDYGALRMPSGQSTGEGSILEPSKNDIVDELNREAAEYAAEHKDDAGDEA